jgi:hypothetical protein
MTIRHTAKKVFAGQYVYRGYTIDGVPTESMNGTISHWNIIAPGCDMADDAANTLRDAKEFIDCVIDIDNA